MKEMPAESGGAPSAKKKETSADKQKMFDELEKMLSEKDQITGASHGKWDSQAYQQAVRNLNNYAQMMVESGVCTEQEIKDFMERHPIQR